MGLDGEKARIDQLRPVVASRRARDLRESQYEEGVKRQGKPEDWVQGRALRHSMMLHPLAEPIGKKPEHAGLGGGHR